MLYNDAIPKYYSEFRSRVVSGEIPVCENISMEMNRIDSWVEDPNIWYDPDAVEGFIDFCESELTLVDGSDVYMLDSFKLWAEQLYGWYIYIDRDVFNAKTKRFEQDRVLQRMINKQYLIVARGAAKSMYMSFIHSYELLINTSTTNQIAVAPTMRQAQETLGPMATAITRARGPLYQFMTEGSIRATSNKARRVKLASTKKGIENFLTESICEIRPMSVDKLQGLRPRVSTVDEWLSGDVKEDVIGAIEQGASKLDDYIILAVSSEGTVRSGVGDTIKMELQKILRGEYEDNHTSIFHYRLDDISEVANPELWEKAQPNIGKTISYEAYQRDVKRAEAAPAARNDILAKRFGIPMEGYTYFFTYEETLPFERQDFWKLPCSLGADLSQGDDFCAFTFLFPRGDWFGVKTLNFISQDSYDKLPSATRYRYDTFIQEGSLIVMPGMVLDMTDVYDMLDSYIDENQYDVRSMGFDPYNARAFVDRWERENGPYGIVKVIQGVKTESVPLGEIKRLATNRVLVFDQELFSYTMGNSITLEDTNGNRKLLKMRADRKIDAVAALIDAWIAYKQCKEQYE